MVVFSRYKLPKLLSSYVVLVMGLMVWLSYSTAGHKLPSESKFLKRADTELQSSAPGPVLPNATNSSVQISAHPHICSQASAKPDGTAGYIHLDHSHAIYFWLVEAKNNPDQAPLVIWLNGGPGSSSMLGLFRGNGPCTIRRDRSGFDVNPQAWNENANMIFVDQPVGTGYSYGERTARSTPEAMSDLYEAIQIWLANPNFSKFIGRQFGVWTESYGGHYGPALVDHILTMNDKLAKSPQDGKVVIPVQSLGLGNALINARAQYISYLTYAQSNPYNKTWVSQDAINVSYKHFNQPNSGCYDMIKTCQASLDAYKCRAASTYCYLKVFAGLVGDRNTYDIREDDTDPYPPNLAPVLNDSKFKTLMGVPSTVQWVKCNDDVDVDFESSGDWMRDHSKQLERIINSGVRTFLFAGDADFRVNYQGMERLIDSLNVEPSKSLVNKTFTDWYIGDDIAGMYKTSSTFSYLRVFGAGHEVPAYGHGNIPRGRAAKAYFDQIISNMSISSLKA